MNRCLVFTLFVSISFPGLSQLRVERIKPATLPGSKELTLRRAAPLQLPFWEDFSTDTITPDTINWKSGSGVYISPTAGINTPSLNVAVFDGLDDTGNPYDLSSSLEGLGDSLYSQVIDLSLVPVNKRNSVYMSFFWQAKGLGEIPDITDSLSLFFKNDSMEWVIQKINDRPFTSSLVGGEDALNYDSKGNLIFRQTVIPIKDSRYFHKDFQFKFEHYGSQQGNFDSWLIDYLYINIDRNPTDTIFDDRALTILPQTPFKEYHAIPYDHFTDSELNLLQPIKMEVYNLEDNIQPMSYGVELVDPESGDVLVEIDSKTFNDPIKDFQRIEFFSNPINKLDLLNTDDTLTFDLKAFINSGDSTKLLPFTLNDTVVQNYNLIDAYAYDDGTAEFAAGLNISDGQVVQKFGILKEDTLTHLDIYFPQLFPPSAGTRITIRVYSALDDQSESLITSRTLLTPTAPGINGFRRIELNPRLVSDTIYIGIQQSKNDYFPIGLDKNNNNGDKIYFNDGEGWQQNLSVEGSLMMRPVFGGPHGYLVEVKSGLSTLKIYPNPVRDLLSIEGSFDQLTITDLYGKSYNVPVSYGNTVDLGQLKNGLYLLTLEKDGQYVTKKILKKK